MIIIIDKIGKLCYNIRVRKRSKEFYMVQTTKQIRHSAVRDTIYSYLCDTKEHPSADMIYNDLKPSNPQLSLGTVYRNLKQFEDMGKVIRVANVNGNERYDANTSDHVHLVCDKCGCVIDVMEADMNAAKAACNLAGGAKITGIQIVLHGTCTDCSN